MKEKQSEVKNVKEMHVAVSDIGGKGEAGP